MISRPGGGSGTAAVDVAAIEVRMVDRAPRRCVRQAQRSRSVHRAGVVEPVFGVLVMGAADGPSCVCLDASSGGGRTSWRCGPDLQRASTRLAPAAPAAAAQA